MKIKMNQKEKRKRKKKTKARALTRKPPGANTSPNAMNPIVDTIVSHCIRELLDFAASSLDSVHISISMRIDAVDTADYSKTGRSVDLSSIGQNSTS